MARREMRRRPWRTALVLLMVVLPTGTMAAIATYLRSSEWSAADQLEASYGQADAGASLRHTGLDPSNPYGPAVTDAAVDDLREALPAGSRVLVERLAQDRVVDGDRRAYFDVTDLDLDDPMTEGRFVSRRGERPRSIDEAVVTESLADDLGVEIGDRFEPERLGRSLRIVGTVRHRSWQQHLVVVGTGGVEGGRSGRAQVWVDLPGRPYADGAARDVATGAAISGVQVPGGELSPAAPWPDDTNTDAIFWTYVGGGVGLAVLGTIIAAAFAVSARRQLHTIGLLSATGAAPGAIRWFLVLQGVTAGALGSAVGVGLGVAVARATPRRILDGIAGHPVDGAVTNPVDLVPIVVIGTIAAAVAAWLPARTVATVPTLQALAGRRPLARVPAHVPTLGALAIGAGCVLFAIAVAGAGGSSSSLWALVAIAGGLACLFGALAVAPWLVAGVERVSARRAGALRLAGRSIGRSRVRSSAVVGAICAVAATVLAGFTLYNSENVAGAQSNGCCARELPHLLDDQILVSSYEVTFVPAISGDGFQERHRGLPVDDAVAAQIDAIVPGARMLAVPEVRVGASAPWVTFDPPPIAGDSFGGANVRIGIADPELLDALDVPDDLRAALARGEAVSVVEPRQPSTGVRVSAIPDAETAEAAHPPAVVPLGGTFESRHASRALPEVLVSTSTARALGLVEHPSQDTIVMAPEPLTEDQIHRLRLLSEDLSWEQDQNLSPEGYTRTHIVPPPEEPDVPQALIKASALAGALLLVLAVVAVGLALAARDSEDERQVLTAVGAPPSVLRRVGAMRAALLVTVAVLIAVPAGLLPAAAVVAAGGSANELRIDVWSLAFVVVALPSTVGAVALAGAVARDRLRPTRPDVFAFSE